MTDDGEPLRICVVVNKHDGRLSYSETFLEAHITGLPFDVRSLIGPPGARRAGPGPASDPMSRSLAARVVRRLRRSLGLAPPVAVQDTRSLVRYLQDEEIDGVLAEYGPTAISVHEACRRADVPLVAHFHGYDAYRLPRDPEILSGYQEVFEVAAAVVGVSRAMVDQLVRLGAPPDRVFLNSCGVEIPDDSAQPAAAPPRFVAVGRFTEKKTPFATLLAFSKLAREVQGASLEMIGDGDLLPPSQELARVLGITDSVTFHGSVPHDAVLQHLRGARCFVQHSAVSTSGDSEGTPVAVLEAMATGLPVVATRHAGIPDIVEENVSGILVDELDIAAMARAMAELARDPQRAEAMGRAGRIRIQEEGTMERSLERLAEIVREAVIEK